MDDSTISFQHRKGKRGKHVVVLTRDGTDLDRDEINVDDFEKRRKYLDRIGESFPSINRIELEGFLLQIADQPSAEQCSLNEVLDADIARPERIIRSDFSAISVPIKTRNKSSMDSQWWTLSVDSNGDRKCHPLEAEVKNGDHSIYIHPCPGIPAIQLSVGIGGRR